MPAPTKQADIVVIHQTYGTPENYNKAHPYRTKLIKDGNDDLIAVEEVMFDGDVEVLRSKQELNYDGNGDLESVTTKIYGLDGVTVVSEFTDNLIPADDPENIDREVE